MANSQLQHFVYEVFEHQKNDLFQSIFKEVEGLGSVVIFTNTREDMQVITTDLSHSGVAVEAIHSKKKASSIALAIEQFRAGGLEVLVLTDAFAREIEIQQARVIINFDFPELIQDYRNRLELGGSTESFEKMVSLVTPSKEAALMKLEADLQAEVPRAQVEGFCYDSKAQKKGTIRNKTRKIGGRSKPLQNKKKKLKPKWKK